MFDNNTVPTPRSPTASVLDYAAAWMRFFMTVYGLWAFVAIVSVGVIFGPFPVKDRVFSFSMLWLATMNGITVYRQDRNAEEYRDQVFSSAWFFVLAAVMALF